MSNCSCVYIGDYDGPSFIRSSFVKAIKQHKCYECGRVIESGEKYEYTVGMWNSFLVIKTCNTCLNIRNEFFCEGWAYGDIIEDVRCKIHSNDGAVSEDCILNLIPEAQEIIFNIIEDIWKNL